jgi:uncharacterized OB-fold protein
MNLERALEAPMHAYQRQLNAGVLAFQYSPSAQRAVFYPRLVCPFSGSDQLEWRASAGRGIVYAATYLYPKGEPAYNVVLVDLDEGFRMMSRVLTPDGLAGDTVKIGDRVRVHIVHKDGADSVPFFEPEGAAA